MGVHGRQGFQSKAAQTAMDWNCYSCSSKDKGRTEKIIHNLVNVGLQH